MGDLKLIRGPHETKKSILIKFSYNSEQPVICLLRRIGVLMQYIKSANEMSPSNGFGQLVVTQLFFKDLIEQAKENNSRKREWKKKEW